MRNFEMKHNALFKLVEEIEKPTKASEMMEYSNSYYRQMNPNEWNIPFADKDIQYVKLFEFLDCTDREKDIMFISNFFHSAYVTLHVTILALGERPSPGSLIDLKRTFDTLQRLDAIETLLNGKITIEEFNDIIRGMTDD
jgi:hypothetical protein